MELVNVAVVVY